MVGARAKFARWPRRGRSTAFLGSSIVYTVARPAFYLAKSKSSRAPFPFPPHRVRMAPQTSPSFPSPDSTAGSSRGFFPPLASRADLPCKASAGKIFSGPFSTSRAGRHLFPPANRWRAGVMMALSVPDPRLVSPGTAWPFFFSLHPLVTPSPWGPGPSAVLKGGRGPLLFLSGMPNSTSKDSMALHRRPCSRPFCSCRVAKGTRRGFSFPFFDRRRDERGEVHGVHERGSRPPPLRSRDRGPKAWRHRCLLLFFCGQGDQSAAEMMR